MAPKSMQLCHYLECPYIVIHGFKLAYFLGSEDAEWEETRTYLMPQVKALVGRYSKLGDKAFYHLYLDIDEAFAEAMKPHEIITVR